ncbi:MAG: hypothetical protein AAB365_00140 [Patescibacteria group bacterium]
MESLSSLVAVLLKVPWLFGAAGVYMLWFAHNRSLEIHGGVFGVPGPGLKKVYVSIGAVLLIVGIILLLMGGVTLGEFVLFVLLSLAMAVYLYFRKLGLGRPTTSS